MSADASVDGATDDGGAVSVVALEGIPEIRIGDDLPAIIVGAIEGTASGALPVLEAGATESSAAKQVYAPGEEPRPREGEPTASAHGELL